MSFPHDRDRSGDLDLVRRIERDEARIFEQTARGVLSIAPQGMAAVIAVAGGVAARLGRGYPLNRAAGLGLDGPVDVGEIERLEAFYRDAGLPPQVDLSPASDAGLRVLLENRDYRPERLFRIYARRPAGVAREVPGGRAAGSDTFAIRRAVPGEGPLWAHTAALGFQNMDFGEPGRELYVTVLSAFSAPESIAYFAEVGGEPAAVARLALIGRNARLGGMSTLPRYRRRGIQRALIRQRLRDAVAGGADVATVKIEPGETSERNVRRAGFTLAYEKATWTRGEKASP